MPLHIYMAVWYCLIFRFIFLGVHYIWCSLQSFAIIYVLILSLSVNWCHASDIRFSSTLLQCSLIFAYIADRFLLGVAKCLSYRIHTIGCLAATSRAYCQVSTADIKFILSAGNSTVYIIHARCIYDGGVIRGEIGQLLPSSGKCIEFEYLFFGFLFKFWSVARGPSSNPKCTSFSSGQVLNHQNDWQCNEQSHYYIKPN